MRNLLAELSRALPSLLVSGDPADKIAYARDLWPRHHLAVRAGRVADATPGCIVWPTSTEDVTALARWAYDSGTPLVPLGGGSGVCAGVLPREDVVVVDMKRMARWRRLDRHAPELEVEAGHMGTALEEGLSRQGLTLGHFPSSIMCSTVGGWVAARSAGQCSGRYGKIEDMVVSLECVTGRGDVVRLHQRHDGPSLVPLVVGSEGTLGIVTSVALRLHPAPIARELASWSFATLEDGWHAMRRMFQAGLRPAVLRLYDPFDAMLARSAKSSPGDDTDHERASPVPGLGAVALRQMLRRPGWLNALLHSSAGGKLLGGALLIAVFEGEDPKAVRRELDEARALCAASHGRDEGEDPARRWLAHRYAINYRQAPMFAAGAFVDTMEVAAPWSKLGALYEGVRRALGRHVFVMAHFSHAYPDGCCIYFSFAGSAAPDADGTDWDAACEVTYDRAWRAALDAAVEAGGTIAHHHGVGRSKAPELPAELGAGVEVIRTLRRVFDPKEILNPGNLGIRRAPSSLTSPSVARQGPAHAQPPLAGSRGPRPPVIDGTSQLAQLDALLTLSEAERLLSGYGFSLDLAPGTDLTPTIGDWLAQGAPGAREAWLDPVDHLLAGFEASLPNGAPLVIRPAPRRAVGPDLSALVVGCGHRFLTLRRAWLRVHPIGQRRPVSSSFKPSARPVLEDGERALLDAIEVAMRS